MILLTGPDWLERNCWFRHGNLNYSPLVWRIIEVIEICRSSISSYVATNQPESYSNRGNNRQSDDNRLTNSDTRIFGISLHALVDPLCSRRVVLIIFTAFPSAHWPTVWTSVMIIRAIIISIRTLLIGTVIERKWGTCVITIADIESTGIQLMWSRAALKCGEEK